LLFNAVYFESSSYYMHLIRTGALVILKGHMTNKDWKSKTLNLKLHLQQNALVLKFQNLQLRNKVADEHANTYAYEKAC